MFSTKTTPNSENLLNSNTPNITECRGGENVDRINAIETLIAKEKYSGEDKLRALNYLTRLNPKKYEQLTMVTNQ